MINISSRNANESEAMFFVAFDQNPSFQRRYQCRYHIFSESWDAHSLLPLTWYHPLVQEDGQAILVFMNIPDFMLCIALRMGLPPKKDRCGRRLGGRRRFRRRRKEEVQEGGASLAVQLAVQLAQ